MAGVADTPSVPHLQRLLDAVVTIGSELDLAAVLRRIVETATDLVDARYGALGVLDESRSGLSEFFTVGLTLEEEQAIGTLPKGRGILGLLISEPRPLRLRDLAEHPDSFGFPPDHPPMHSFLGVPIRVRGQVFGNLYLTDKRSADEFTDADEELVVGLATAAAVAIENARLHARVAEMALVRDRERIARDLHDLVIQRLFATGLTLQGAARLAESTSVEVADRLQQAVDDIDVTIRQIRSTIFELGTGAGGGGLRSDVLALCEEITPALGFRPSLRFDGPVDSAVPTSVAQHLLAVLREALANVARHADAHVVEVELTVDPTRARVELRVDDDGRGLSDQPGAGGRGLRNMESRARALGGALVVSPRGGGGTGLRWGAPLRDG